MESLEMHELRSEDEIKAGWQGDDEVPAVSICCVAYNHEKYIETALKSFLMQETNFPFEIIVGEDCSSDDTFNIISRYREKYPNLIKVISNKNNVGMHKNFFRVFDAAKGEYIAICEGDDSWADKEKLQKQKDFMDSDEEYVVCYGAADIFDEYGGEKGRKFASSYRDSSREDLIYAKVTILTMTSFVRARYLRELPREMDKVLNLDRFIFSYLGQFGKGKFISGIRPSVYNIHAGGIWSLLDKNKKEESAMVTYYWMANYYDRAGSKAASLYFYLKAVKVLLRKVTARHIICAPSLMLAKVKRWS